MTPLRLVFAALTVWGAIHPMSWFLTYMRETGTGLAGLIDAWYVNASTTGLTWDLIIAAIALTVWILAESLPRRDWLAVVAIPATFCIGVSCGLPPGRCRQPGLLVRPSRHATARSARQGSGPRFAAQHALQGSQPAQFRAVHHGIGGLVHTHAPVTLNVRARPSTRRCAVAS